MDHLHISWDLWGTLITSNPIYRTKRNWLIQHIFGGDISAESIRVNKDLVDKINEATLGHLSYTQIMAIITSQNIRGLREGNFSSKVEEFKEKNLRLVKDHPPLLLPAADYVLYSLYDMGVTMNILSNTSVIPGMALRAALAELDIERYFLFQMYSDEQNLSKPNGVLFWNMMNRIKAQKVIHIGDNTLTDDVTSHMIPRLSSIITKGGVSTSLFSEIAKHQNH